MKALHLKYWNTVYETAATRQVRVLSYYSKPNKLVGEGLGHMLNQPDGLALYGTWTFLEILASTAPQEQRGWLVRNGTPMDATRMSALTHIPVPMIERALSFFSTAPLDWLEELEWEGGRQGELPVPLGTPSASHQAANGTPSASHQAANGKSVRGKTDKRKTEETEEREEEYGGFASKEEARQAQTQQFAATSARKRELEAVPKAERDEEQTAEIKKMARLLKAIQKKQRAGDFTPVREETL
jgi:hypothetical protein